MRRDSGARHRPGAVWGAVRNAALITLHGQIVEADAQHTAAAIAQELKKFFAEQGWIAPP